MENPDVEKPEKNNRQILQSNTKSNSKQQSIEKANELPDWLPDGWNMEVRTRKSGVHMGSGYKCYIEPLKGYKFFSKPEVLRYLETVKDNNCTSNKGKKCSKTHSPKENSCTSKKEKKCSDMHSSIDNNCTSKKEKKCSNMDSRNDNSFTPNKEKNCSSMDSPNNNSCTPKKENNCSNMGSPNDDSCTPKKEKNCSNMDSPNDNSFTPNKEKNCSSVDSPNHNSCTPKKEKNCSIMDSTTDVVIEKSIAEDLPPGWVKELKIRKNGKGIRKDPFYIDPASGYVFRSKKDVLRYLESGDIGSCAFKPSRRQIQDEGNLTPPPSTKRQKLKQSAPEKQISSATEIVDKSNLELPDANISRKGQNANVSSVASVPKGKSVVKMHSLEDRAANSSEVKKTSDPGSSALLNESLKESEQVLSADDVQEKEHVVKMMENANEKNHSNHSISKNRKGFNVPHRSSPRLAGSKPVELANNVINEQTLQIPKRNLRKSRNTLDVDISEDQTVSKEQPHQQETDKKDDNKPEIQISSNKSSKKKEHHLPRRASKRLAAIEHESMSSKAELQQSKCGPVTVLAVEAPINGKSANKRKKSEPRLGKSENEEMDSEKSEPQLSFAFHYSWSDPSLEYAINTLTGVLPPADNLPTTVPETDIPKSLVDNVTTKGATTVPETDIQKALVDNVTGRNVTMVPEIDTKKTLVENNTGRNVTTIPEVDTQKTTVDNVMGGSATTIPEADTQKTSVDNVMGRSAITIPEVDTQKTSVDNVMGRSATTIPEADTQKTSVDNVMGRSATTIPETDTQKTLVDNVMGRNATTIPETDDHKTLVNNVTGRSTTTIPETDTQKTLVDNVMGRSATTIPETDTQKTLVDNVMGRSATTIPETDDHKTLVNNVTGRSTTTVPETDIQKTLVDNVMGRCATTIPETDTQKTLVDNVMGRSATTIPETDDHKTLVNNVTGRSTTTVPETDIQKTLIDNVTGRSVDNGNKLFDPVTGSRDRKSQVRSNKPKRKKAIKTPMRLSKRLAGLEPEVQPAERALEYSTRKSCKEGPTAAATLANGVSGHHDAGEETKLTRQASDSLKTEVPGDSLNQSEKSYDAQNGLKEELQKVETGNVGDVRSEPQLSLQFGDSWSDPCLEFAIKTLTGALPIDAGADMPALPPGFDNPPYKHSYGSVVTSINLEAHDNSHQSLHKKELNMVSQPEVRTSSTDYENAPRLTTRESYLEQGNIIRNLDEEPRHPGNIMQPVCHSRNINSLTHEESLKQNGQVVEGGSVTKEKQLFETGTVNHDNSELQYCAPFMNSWSDPCLEFAFKTLTGVLPVEENLSLQGCFQEPVDYQDRRDCGSMLPDFGSSSFSQSDFSFLHDTGVKSMPGQQSSMSSSFLPLEKTSLQGLAGVDPQAQVSQCNNNFQRR